MLHTTASRQFLICAAVALAATTRLATPCWAWVQGEYCAQSIAGAMAYAVAVNDDTSFGFDDGVSVLAAYMEPGATTSFVRRFEGGQAYCLVATGDEDVRDLDLEIIDPDGAAVVWDRDTDQHPMLVFTAPRTGAYEIKLRLYRAVRDSFCAMAVLREGGYKLPADNIAAAAVNLLRFCEEVGSTSTAPVRFNARDNQWALFGSVLREDEEVTVSNLTFDRDRTIALSAADDNADDVDLFVLDDFGSVSAEDVLADALPVVEMTPDRRHTKLRVKNVDSRGPSLVFTAVLTA